ncbi:hypothetical protein GDO81_022911 [Engystomops pustulosus]|uniref:PAS domain-containing protein n=1 Tax=Engystomops pustulosus TaxID=76066 RepID=A0AAV6Z7T1_ENGPU|nr:hypothetical protein GDO81_022911 [Engystomops pustulosus]
MFPSPLVCLHFTLWYDIPPAPLRLSSIATHYCAPHFVAVVSPALVLLQVCVFSGGRERDMNLRYHPFRFTPYLMKVRDSDNTEGQPCCLLIAEKIHSGYEAPRIPPDKRIFTTRHTPSCVFQEVDERAVPLLGYLPQDLIGMPVMCFIHPEDRPLMLAIHKKILQQAGQPFDHSPIRLCARSGEYVTIDTSWSSFVNPWSRKVSFILGRHKVRTSPLNEDVFTAPKGAEMKALDPDIQELSEQIHRILMQPVHNTNSGGNGSGGSNTSQEPFHCNASSSDSNAMVIEDGTDPKPMTFQEFCQNVHKVKSQGQQMFLGSRVIRPHHRGHIQALAPPRTVLPAVDNAAPDTGPTRTPCVPEELARKETSNYSYQQINCLDSIIRYLESCNLPSTVKRKCGSSSYTSSTSEEEKQKSGENDKEGTKASLSHQQNNATANNSSTPLKEGANTGGRQSKSRKSKAKRPKQGKHGSPSSIPTPHHHETPLLPPPPGMTGFPLPMFPPRAPAPEPTPSLPRYPLVTPIVALVLPNYLFQPSPVAPSFYPGVSGFPPFTPTPSAPTPASDAPTPTPPPAQPMATCPPPSRSSSPPQRLFPSRCSSPLQLDLLQMEELPQPSSGGAGTAAVGGDWEIEEDNKGGKGGMVPGNANAGGPSAGSGSGEEDRQPENCMVDPQESSSHNDALSSSSDLLDLLLHEDSCSGTGSAASGSMGSNGGSTSACGTRSSESSNTSKYFGSIDSSETDLRVKKAEREEVEQKVIRYVMQDPLWLLMANADHEVMMSYQLPSRDIESVLQEDREKLRKLQRNQPKFSEEQKKELGEVHSWIRKGRLPHVINITSCTGCSPDAPSYDDDLDLSIMMEEGGECRTGGEGTMGEAAVTG